MYHGYQNTEEKIVNYFIKKPDIFYGYGYLPKSCIKVKNQRLKSFKLRICAYKSPLKLGV